MEWPYTTGLMWTVALVLFGSVFGETFIPIVAVALVGIHLGCALVPRRNGDTGKGTEGKAAASNPSPYVHDRGNHDSRWGIGRHAVSWVRNRRQGPINHAGPESQFGNGLAEHTEHAEMDSPTKVGTVR